MQIVLLPPRHPEYCAPLTSGRDLAQCLIANVSLVQWISISLRQAGFEIIEANKASDKTVFAPIDDWVEPAALCMLARADRKTSLYSSKNELIAWKGDIDPEKCSVRMVTQANNIRIQYPWDLLALNESVLSEIDDSVNEGQISSGVSINGKLRLGKGSILFPGVVIEGNVVIGRDCRIGPNCYIRGATSIADHCVIGAGVEIKNSIIYPHTSMPHFGYIGDSIIGSHVLLGAGTILSNSRYDGRTQHSQIQGHRIDTHRNKFGAVIGDGVRTAVNTTVLPGFKIGRGRTTLPGSVIDKDLM